MLMKIPWLTSVNMLIFPPHVVWRVSDQNDHKTALSTESIEYNWNILKQKETGVLFKCKFITSQQQSFHILIVWLL